MIETCFLKELLKSIFTENCLFFSQTNLFSIKIDHPTFFQPFKTEIYVNQFKQSFVLRRVVNCTEIGVRCLIKVVVSPSFRLMHLKLYLLVVICRLQSYSTPTRYPKWEQLGPLLLHQMNLLIETFWLVSPSQRKRIQKLCQRMDVYPLLYLVLRETLPRRKHFRHFLISIGRFVGIY